MPPHTTKRTTTNLKTYNNQNYQKIELYESPTTKALKKKHLYRPAGAERTCSELVAGGAGGPTSVCRKTGRNDWGARQTMKPRVPVQGNKVSKLWLKKSVGVPAVRETPSLIGEFFGETPGS